MHKLYTSLLLLFFSIQVFTQGNPFVRHIYTADPSAHVWEDGRLYVYPSQDIEPAIGCDRMDKYHVFSTDDMVNWIDHGQILEASQVPWDVPITDASPNATFMWAPDCVYKDGKYYFYFPHPKGPTWNNTWQIGIAVSDEPADNFEILPEPLAGTEVSWVENGKTVTSTGFIDPCVFIDDDGQIYFYMGGGNRCYGGKLKENMIEVDGELIQMTGLYDFHEAAWVFKRDDIYYLTYADNLSGANRLRYAISSSPLGPWSHKGIYLESTTCDTSHGSVVEYKGQWWAFYHNADLSGQGNLRSICVDSLHFNADGTIRKVKQTKDQGTAYDGNIPLAPTTIEAEDFNDGGKGIAYWDNTSGNAYLEYRRNVDVDINKYRQRNMFYVTDMSKGEYLNYTFEIPEDGLYSFDFVIATTKANDVQKFYLEFDFVKMSNPKRYNVEYATLSALNTVTAPNINLQKGVHTMTFYPQGNMNFDKFSIRKEATGVDMQHISSISLLPNPTQDGKFYISNLSEPSTISLFDITGKLIWKKSFLSADDDIELSVQTVGLYLVKIQTSKNTINYKLIYN